MNYQNFLQQPLAIATNSKFTKGVILPYNEGEEFHHVLRRAHSKFYGAFSACVNKDLNTIQAYTPGKHIAAGKTFNNVQFEVLGGITTTNNTNCDTQPTESQCAFLKGRDLQFVKFFNGDYLKQ